MGRMISIYVKWSECMRWGKKIVHANGIGHSSVSVSNFNKEYEYVSILFEKWPSLIDSPVVS